MHPLIEQHRAEIARLCRRYAVRRLEVFGSAARGIDFDPARSDADFLVDFELDTDLPPLEQFFGLAAALEQLPGRPVDLLERPAVESSRNYIRRRGILAEAEPVYGQGA
jgi:predicted nucleotidyltransferase